MMRNAWVCLVSALWLGPLITAWPQPAPRVRAPVEATPIPYRAAETGAPAPRAQETTDVLSTGGFIPQRYRTMPARELQAEIESLSATAERAPTTSPARAELEGMVQSLKMRQRIGILPQDLVSEITSSVALLRGLPVKQPVRFRVMDRTQLRAYLDRELNEEMPPEYLANYEFALKVIGAIPDRTDLRKTIMSLLSEQVAGMYDRKTKLLYVIKDFDMNRALGKIILAHEICHALQDQHFNLSAMPLTARDNDDLSIAAASVIEGDATLVMMDYAREVFTGRDIFTLVDIFSVDQSVLNRAPEFLRQHLTFPYLAGSEFMQTLMVSGPDLRDRVFRQLPVSSTQIIHPEKYYSADRDDPTSFTLPDLSPVLGTSWTRALQSVMGEFQIRETFGYWRQWEIGAEAAAGWDGDRYALYRRGDSYLFVWASAWATTEDAEDFAARFGELLRTRKYKDQFGERDFSGVNGARSIASHAGSGDLGLFLRTVTDGPRVVIQVTNSRGAWAGAERIDQLALEAMRGAAQTAAVTP
jgi:hypothetical protein